LIGVHVLAGNRAFGSLDWSPIFFIVLGLLVLFGFKLAMVLVRIVGLFSVPALVLTPVLLLFAFRDDGGQMSYGSLVIIDPAPWQVGLFLFCLAATILPPWWSLERMFADDNKDSAKN